MTLEEMRSEMLLTLERYEESMRRYCDKVERDRPWVAENLWNSAWTFRKGLLMQIKTLEEDIAAAKNSSDPG
jgi:hypothetical protein